MQRSIVLVSINSLASYPVPEGHYLLLPALLSFMRRMVPLGLVTVLLCGLAACTPASTQRSTSTTHGAYATLSDHVSLTETKVLAGQIFFGSLVVDNTGKTFNLTDGCRPQLAVALDGNTQAPSDSARYDHDSRQRQYNG